MMPQHRRPFLLVLLLVLLLPAAAHAQLASRSTEAWIELLDAPGRIATLRIDEIVQKLHLKTGDVVADIGAGTGVFSVPLAKAVGPSGKVYAVEVDKGLVNHIRDKAAAQNVRNVEAVLGQFGDPGLSSGDLDLAFFHDALHHIADRTGYLAKLVASMKRRSRIAVVEMDSVKGAHRNDPALQITKAQFDQWMSALGFTRQEVVDLSEDKWLALYARGS